MQTLGFKHYELTNHLGNVLSVVTDNINISPDSAFAKIVAATDYYAFGSEMPGRTYSGGGQEGAYRYGFNGKEKDTENTWGDTSYDYGFRIYNPRYGRFLSVDPLTQSYPWYTPYQFAGNKPIAAIDIDGLEEKIVIWNTDATEPQIYLVNTEQGKRTIDIFYKSFHKGIHIDVGQWVQGFEQYSGNGNRDFPLYRGTLIIDGRNGYPLLTYQPPQISKRQPSDLEVGFSHLGERLVDFATKDDLDNRVGRKMVGGIVTSAFALPIRTAYGVFGLVFGANEIASGVNDAMENDSNVDSNILRDAADSNIPNGGKMFDAIKVYYDLKSAIRAKNKSILDFETGNKTEGMKNMAEGAKSIYEVVEDVSKLKTNPNENQKQN